MNGVPSHPSSGVDGTVSNLGRRAKQLGCQLVRMSEGTDGSIGAESLA